MGFKDQGETGNFCPFLKGDCKEKDCMLYIRVRGKRPQEEIETDLWGCSLAYIPLLQIETSQTVRGVQGAVESFRNETLKQNEETRELLEKQPDDAQFRITDGEPK